MCHFQSYPEEGNLKGVKHRVSITKYYKRYYVTNSTGKHIISKCIVNHYRVRWIIEVLFRVLKQLCHLQDCVPEYSFGYFQASSSFYYLRISSGQKREDEKSLEPLS